MIIIFVAATGQIMRALNVPIHEAPMNLSPGESWIVDVDADHVDGNAQYVSLGRVALLPERPALGAKWASWDWNVGTWVVDVAQASADVRAERDALLSGTDWTQGRDIPESLAVRWAPYRQALRDIPGQPGFPLDVVWPTAPT